MSAPAISVEGLGKLYRLAHEGPRPDTFREAMMRAVTAPLRRFRELSEHGGATEEFWALRDVSFTVQQGEVIGVVGRNGAGKSTLLKILSRIVEPTEGRAVLRGRVASLLEVGTGFHPELSGRENIYLNGSILGMKRREIDRKFDEIVAFAEVEKFLDTPVKRYSSGMYVRLAFAVAAHLEPEILIVDEVLAVGDAEFQKKCLGKMRDVASGGGRTVVFVSHNMAAVRQLCATGVLLKDGRVAMLGTADEVAEAYMLAGHRESDAAIAEFERPAGASIWMERVEVQADGEPSATLEMGGRLSLVVDFASSTPVRDPRFGIVISTMGGDRLINMNNRYQPCDDPVRPMSRGRIRCDLGVLPLMAGKYLVSLYMGRHADDEHRELDRMSLTVTERDCWGRGRTPPTVSHFWWPTRFAIEELPTHAAVV